jgi:hypothetical protein
MSTWDRVKERAAELSQKGSPAEMSSTAWNKTAEFGYALCEEIERLEAKIDSLGEKRGRKKRGDE